MYDRSKEQYPDAMALIRVGDEYKAYNQDAERLHEVLGVCARKAVSEKDGTPVMTASFRHVDLDTHLRSIIKAGSKVAINHYEKAAAPNKSMTPPLLFKGGRREIEITSEGAVIRTNGNQYDATGILKGLEKAGMGKHVTGTGNRPEPCKTENAVLYPETALRLRCAHSGHQRKNFLISSKRIMITKR